MFTLNVLQPISKQRQLLLLHLNRRKTHRGGGSKQQRRKQQGAPEYAVKAEVTPADELGKAQIGERARREAKSWFSFLEQLFHQVLVGTGVTFLLSTTVAANLIN